MRSAATQVLVLSLTRTDLAQVVSQESVARHGVGANDSDAALAKGQGPILLGRAEEYKAPQIRPTDRPIITQKAWNRKSRPWCQVATH